MQYNQHSQIISTSSLTLDYPEYERLKVKKLNANPSIFRFAIPMWSPAFRKNSFNRIGANYGHDVVKVKTTRDNGWFALRLKAFVTDQTLKGL